jgi:hypothetical protein
MYRLLVVREWLYIAGAVALGLAPVVLIIVALLWR